MDFGIYPPEINSGRMYTGPGAATDAHRRRSLARIGRRTAFGGQLVSIGGLGIDRRAVGGDRHQRRWPPRPRPTSAWLNATAAQAEETAAQAKAAAAAYQTAFTSTVPPPMVAANRSQLMTLVATNLFGRNTQAIAANEAQYAEMWAQDAAAMYGYAASSASATSLTPFTPPQQNTNPGGSAGQAAAVSQATGTSAGNVQSTVSSIQQAFSAVPNALTSAATSAQTTPLRHAGPDQRPDLHFLRPARRPGQHFRLRTTRHSGDTCPFPSTSAVTGTGVHTDDIVSGWNGEQSLAGNRAGAREAVPGAPPQPARGHAAAAQPFGRIWARPTRSERCPCRRRGPSPHRR